jgi:hypothetical protein
VQIIPQKLNSSIRFISIPNFGFEDFAQLPSYSLSILSGGKAIMAMLHVP